jgi:nicotinamide-nucleotide amidase
MTAAILCTGTELTRGELVNTNATWLAEELTSLGFEVGAVDCVDDDRDRIRRALTRLGAEHEVVLCTGGLGPTTDDLTTECVAGLLAVPLVRDAASLEHIRALLARFGRGMAPSNAKQADFPEGASIIPNPRGTAPGFYVRIGRALAFFFPGVPREMKAMFRETAVPVLAPLVQGGHHQLRLRCFGLPESEVNDRLSGVEAEFEVNLGYRASFPEIEVKVLARAANPADAKQRAEAATRVVRERLGEAVFGEGTTTYAESLLALLGERGATLSLAESCTGGLVAEMLTRVPGSSRTFLGGTVAYANEAKTALLGVDAAAIASHGAVSEPVARAMAEGARARFGSTLSLSVTGIAGPDGGTPEKPVGLVHFAVADARGTSAEQVRTGGTREQVRLRAAYIGLRLVRRVLLNGHGAGGG